MLVEKEVIRPGTYWYIDEATKLPRKLVVTPELTKHWHEQGNKMLGLGLTVPVPCEHDFDAHPMTPADKLKNNAGWVKEYRLKGDGLFSVVDIQDPELVRKLPKTVRYTSPWINSFTDGQGRDWKNVISHLALTTRPRIVDQEPFPSVAAALAMATEAKLSDEPGPGFCLSEVGLLNAEGKPERPIAFSLYAGGVRLAEGDAPPPPKKEESAPNPEPEAKTGDVGMEELLCDLLSALGIHLPESSGGDFQRQLYEATMQKIKELTGQGHKPGGGGLGAKPNPTPPSSNNPLIQQEQQPMYMSLEEINKIEDVTMKTIALSMYNENVKLRGELESNSKATASLRDARLKEESGRRAKRIANLSRLSPKVKADLEAMAALPAMALSLGDNGEVVDPMAGALSLLEKGLSDIPQLLTTERTALSVAPQPTDAEMSQEETDKLADEMARMMGCAPQAKAS